MLNQVKVIAHPESGKEIVPSTKTKGWGTIRVDSDEVISFTGKIVNMRKRSAFINGPIKVLEALLAARGTTWTGKIVRHTSVKPFFESQSPVINPDTKEVVLRNGEEFYQNFLYTEDLSATDKEIVPEPEMA